MAYGPATAAGELPYRAMIASFVLVLLGAAVAAGDEPNISGPTYGGCACDGAAGAVETPEDRKSAKGSLSA